MNSFEEYIRKKYTIGYISSDDFVFNGMRIFYDHDEDCIILSQPDTKDIESITLRRTRSKDIESDASTIELNRYRSITGSLLWYGTQTVPHLLFLASSMARQMQSLKVKHLKQANSNVKYGVTS